MCSDKKPELTSLVGESVLSVEWVWHWTWRRGIRFRMRVKKTHQTRIHVSLSLNTIESLFDLVKYGFWSGDVVVHNCDHNAVMDYYIRANHSITGKGNHRVHTKVVSL